MSPAVTVAAFIALLEGDVENARQLALEASTRQGSGETEMIAEKARILIASGEEEHAHRLAEHMPDSTRAANARVTVQAMLAEVAGDPAASAALYHDAAHKWRSFGHPLELAHALAGHARCLTTMGKHAEAEQCATEAASLFRGLGVDLDLLATAGWPLDGSVSGIARP